MKFLFNQRLAYHQKKIMRYMKYVFNDHFVLICMFLLGGLGLYYSNLVKTLNQDFSLGYVVIGGVWLICLSLGRLATLTHEADKVFLLPKEQAMQGYLKKAFGYSLILPLFLCVIFVGVTMPLYVAISGQGFDQFFWFLLLVFLLKISELAIQLLYTLQINPTNLRRLTLIWWAMALVSVSVGLLIAPWIAVILAAMITIATIFLVKNSFTRYSLDWEQMIQREQNRMHRIYQFINLFTDVPEIASGVKRRKLWDGLLNKISKTHNNTYYYLYFHSFVRGTEYSGVYIRLLLICGITVGFLSTFWLNLGVVLLFLYLIGFQLLPLYSQFDYMLLTKLYPVSDNEKNNAIQKLLGQLLLMATVVLTICSAIGLKDISVVFIAAALFIETFGLVKFYIPYRLKK